MSLSRVLDEVSPRRFEKEVARSDLPNPTSIFSNTSPPPDLTRHIVKIDDQYLAGGGFGDVYKCRYTGVSTPQEVAVKALRFKSTLDGDTGDKSLKMLHRELGIWKRLRHKNIVPFLGIAYGFGMSGAMSLVSLWMPNDTLHKFLATHDDKLDVAHRLQILLDIAEGLHYLHSFPIVHGDLNANNVLLDVDYTACLADFGYASAAGNIPEALSYLERSTARPGALRWVAPEQIDLEGTSNRTTRSDIYSFGCVLSGKQPWSEVREDASIVLRLHLGHKPSRPECRRMDDAHWNFIQCCWLSLQERPTTDTILLSIQRLLRDFPQSGSIRDVFVSSANRGGLPEGPDGLNPTTTESTRMSDSLPDKDKNDQKSRSQNGRFTTKSHRSLLSRTTHKGSFIRAILGTAFQLHEDDIIVFVLGPSASGRNSFIGAMTQARSHVQAGQDLRPSAEKLQTVRCELTEEAWTTLGAKGPKNLVLVDTPSFHAEENTNAAKEMTTWLRKSRCGSTRSGTIYMHRVESGRNTYTGSIIQKQLDMFAQTFPQNFTPQVFPERLHCVFSRESDISEGRIEHQKEKFQKQLGGLRPSRVYEWEVRWDTAIHPDLFVKGDASTAWNAVKTLFSRPGSQ